VIMKKAFLFIAITCAALAVLSAVVADPLIA